MGDSFVHLHLHTEFSMLDGAARVAEVIDAAVADGQPAVGITDHGNMYGVLDFYKACRDAGVKPVIGMEAYMAGESRFERPTRRGRVDDSGGETEGGQEALLPPDPARREPGRIPQPHQAREPGLPRGLLLPSRASTGSCSSATTRASSRPRAVSVATCCSR